MSRWFDTSPWGFLVLEGALMAMIALIMWVLVVLDRRAEREEHPQGRSHGCPTEPCSLCDGPESEVEPMS